MDTIPKLDFEKMPEVLSSLMDRGYYPMILIKDNSSNGGIKGVYGVKDLSKLIGLSIFTTRDYEKIMVNNKKVYFEFRKFIHMLYKGKLPALDFLFCPADLIYGCSELMKDVRASRHELVNINKVFSSAQEINDKNYKSLFNVKKKGRLKFCRESAINIIKTSCRVSHFMEFGEWKMDTSEFLPDFQKEIEYSPETISKDLLNSKLQDVSCRMYQTWINRSVYNGISTKFNYERANNFIIKYSSENPFFFDTRMSLQF